MEMDKDMRGKKVFERKLPSGWYEIYENLDTSELPYIGCYNGERSITGDRPDVVMRGLQRKHVTGLPEGKLLDFTAHRASKW